MFNTSDFIYIHIYVWLSGRIHRAGISDSISAPAPCSLLSLVTVPGKLGLLERGNTLQSAVGVFAWASLLLAPRFRFPGKAGRAAGRCKGGPEETILPRRGHHVTDGITAVNLPTLQSLPCHAKPATTRPCLQPGVCSLRRWNRQPKASPGIPARPGCADTHAWRLLAQSSPLPAPRAFVEQITSKCLALRHRERGKPRFVPGSAHNIKKAAAPLKNTTACKLSN